MQQVYQKDTAEAREALATLFETYTEAMMPLLNIVVGRDILFRRGGISVLPTQEFELSRPE